MLLPEKPVHHFAGAAILPAGGGSLPPTSARHSFRPRRGCWQLLVYLFAAIPVVGATLYLGGHTHTGFSQQTFVRVISLLLLGSGVMLLLK